LLQQNVLVSTHMRRRTVASLRASATFARFMPLPFRNAHRPGLQGREPCGPRQHDMRRLMERGASVRNRRQGSGILKTAPDHRPPSDRLVQPDSRHPAQSSAVGKRYQRGRSPASHGAAG
jgi:hypothetical protein